MRGELPLVEVACPKKAGARIARDRCCEAQEQEGCYCTIGPVVLQARLEFWKSEAKYQDTRDVILGLHQQHYQRYQAPFKAWRKRPSRRWPKAQRSTRVLKADVRGGDGP